MHILFLDDEDARHSLAEKYLSAAGHKLLHAFTAQEALDIIDKFVSPIGLGMLDHDLQHIVEDETGKRVEYHGLYFVDQLIQTIPQEKWFHRAVVHSYNPSGAKYMTDTLNRNGIPAKMDIFSGDMLKRLVIELSSQ